MCLGELRQVTRVDGGRTVQVRVGDRDVPVSLLTITDPVAVGDWLLVHSGLALARLSADEAAEAQHIRTTTGREI
jgi:hydrogenase assembly chaperone HypC/HupF